MFTSLLASRHLVVFYINISSQIYYLKQQKKRSIYSNVFKRTLFGNSKFVKKIVFVKL